MVRANKSNTAPVAAPAPVASTPVETPVAAAPAEKKRARSSKKDEAAVPPTVVETPAPVAAAAAPKKEKAAKKEKATKAAAPAEVAKEAPAVETAAPASEGTVKTLQTIIMEQGELISSLQSEVASLKINNKNLLKQAEREAKNSQKQMKKKRVTSATSRPSSFKIPTTISNEMADFLGVAHGTQISRTEVNSRIHNYAISKNLRDEKDKRIIYPDNALMSLLRVKEGEKLGYFNIQKFVKGHFATRNSSPAYA